MALSLRLVWHQAVSIREGRADEKLFWVCDEAAQLPTTPGAYVFARLFGGSCSPLYIGQAGNIRARVFGHLKGNVPLLKAIGRAKNGTRVVLPCELVPRRGQRLAKVLDVLEDTLIRQALLAGHELVNVRGARWPTHLLEFRGARHGLRIFGRELKAEA